MKTQKTGDWKFSDELPHPTELMGILDSMLSEKPSGFVVLTSNFHARQTLAVVLFEASLPKPHLLISRERIIGAAHPKHGCLCKTD